jgi:hypothetical protein
MQIFRKGIPVLFPSLVVLSLLAGWAWVARAKFQTKNLEVDLFRRSGDRVRIMVSFKQKDAFDYFASMNGRIYTRGQLAGKEVENLASELVRSSLREGDDHRHSNAESLLISLVDQTDQTWSNDWASKDPAAQNALKLVRQIEPLNSALDQGIFRMGRPQLPSAWPDPPWPKGKLWPEVIAEFKNPAQEVFALGLLSKRPELAKQPNFAEWAVKNGKPALLRCLLEQGAPANQTTTEGKTLIDVARGMQNAEMVALLEQHGADGPVDQLSGPPQKPRRVPVNPCQERLVIDSYCNLVTGWVQRRDFAGLEYQGQKLRSEKTCLSDGMPKLELFYDITSGVNVGQPKWEKIAEFHESWLKAHPQSISARVSRARYFIGYAWHARGGGYANTVSEEQWKRFGEHIEEAERELRRPITREDPMAWCAWITLAQANGWEKSMVESCIQNCRKLIPGCSAPLYYASSYYLPRWHGQPGEWELFAEACSKENLADYSVLCESIINYSGVEKEVTISWPLLRDSYRARLRARPSELVKNKFAWMAHHFKDLKTARQVVAELGPNWDPQTWNEDEDLYNSLRPPAPKN